MNKKPIHIRTCLNDPVFLSDADIEGEVWRDFDCLKGRMLAIEYQASNMGRIRRKHDKHLIKGGLTFDNYHEISLQTAEPPAMFIRVHQVILRVFQGDPPADMQHPTVQHKNHNKLDNRITNLCWMSQYDNNQEGHGVPVKIEDAQGVHEFGSMTTASKYIHRHSDYITECIRNEYDIKDSEGRSVKVWYWSGSKYTLHLPKIGKNRQPCCIITKDETIEFPNLYSCDAYLGKPDGYTAGCIQQGWPVVHDDYQFFLYNHDTCSLEKYIPTSRKHRDHATRCEVQFEGATQEFPSFAAAARHFGIDPEKFRLAAHAQLPISTSSGHQLFIKILHTST